HRAGQVGQVVPGVDGRDAEARRGEDTPPAVTGHGATRKEDASDAAPGAAHGLPAGALAVWGRARGTHRGTRGRTGHSTWHGTGPRPEQIEDAGPSRAGAHAGYGEAGRGAGAERWGGAGPRAGARG